MATVTIEESTIAPQPGPQTQFLVSPADVVVYGGAAGGGKTWALLLDPLLFAALEPVSGFGAVIFRRTSPQITQEGGLWDEAGKIFPLAKGVPNKTRLEWNWPKYKTRIRFAHMQYDQDRFNWQGSQIAYIGFDELTHFTEEQFFYMFSRNRSTSGVKPRIRATTNPDPDSWVKAFLAPWVDETYPNPAKSGEIRFFIRESGNIVWLPAGVTHPDMKSVTFIPANVYDNPTLLKVNPEYLANLKALPLVERERLLNSNWNIRPEGKKFKREWFGTFFDDSPDLIQELQIEKIARGWDKAATAAPKKNSRRSGPDYTAGVKIGRRKEGLFPRYVVLDAQWEQLDPGGVESLIQSTAAQDGRDCYIYIEQEGGSSGKQDIFNFVTKVLTGYIAEGIPSSGSKELRADSFAAQCKVGNVGLVRGWWINGYLYFLCAFPDEAVHDDPVDASSLCFNQLYIATKKDPMELLADLKRRADLHAQHTAKPTQDQPITRQMLLPEKQKAWWE